jgi:hypothetical protein
MIDGGDMLSSDRSGRSFIISLLDNVPIVCRELQLELASPVEVPVLTNPMAMKIL